MSIDTAPWIQVRNGGEPAGDLHVLQRHGGRGAVVATDRTFAWIPPETTRRRRLGARLVAAISGMLLLAPARPRQPSAPSPGTRAAMETARMSREMDRL